MRAPVTLPSRKATAPLDVRVWMNRWPVFRPISTVCKRSTRPISPMDPCSVAERSRCSSRSFSSFSSITRTRVSTSFR